MFPIELRASDSYRSKLPFHLVLFALLYNILYVNLTLSGTSQV